MKYTLTLAALFVSASIAHAEIRYRVQPQPEAKQLAIMVTIPTNAAETLVQAPRWMPGFYMLQNYGARLKDFSATGVGVFGIGLICDYQGTMQMNRIALLYGKAPEWHNITGLTSLAGMAFHFLLALSASMLIKSEAANRVFHRVSLTIYTLWVFAFISGAVSGMMRLKH